MTNYHKIDICNQDNGEGVRTVIWLSGCKHYCKGCFSVQTWNPKSGEPFDDKAHSEFIKGVTESYCDGCTLLGGEPLSLENIHTSTQLAREVKALGKTVWCYTGYTYEQIKDLEIMKYIDVLIDGRFNTNLFNLNLKWRGSANQRVIDVQASRKLDSVVLHSDNNSVTEYYPEQVVNPYEGMTFQEIKEKYIDNVYMKSN